MTSPATATSRRCDAAYYATPDVAVAARSDGTTGGQAAMLNTSLRPTAPRLHADGPGADGRADVRTRSDRQHADASGGGRPGDRRLARWLPRQRRHGFPPAECIPHRSTPSDVAGIAALPQRRDGRGRHARRSRRSSSACFAGRGGADGADQPRHAREGRPELDDGDGGHHRHRPEREPRRCRTRSRQMQSKAIACEYKLPASGVDFKKVNVSFTSGSRAPTPRSVTRRSTAPTAPGCDQRGGWYYDKESRHRHADQDHRLPGDLLDVPDGPERPRQRRPGLPDHRRRLAPPVAAPRQRRHVWRGPILPIRLRCAGRAAVAALAGDGRGAAARGRCRRRSSRSRRPRPKDAGTA